MEKETVRVFPVGEHSGALWLWWDTEVKEEDVPPAFHTLTTALNQAEHPIHVLVDLRNDPSIPLSMTLQETLSGPMKHERMGHWLVIGTNWRAKMLANTFSKVYPRANIHWYDTEEEAFARLAELESPSP